MGKGKKYGDPRKAAAAEAERLERTVGDRAARTSELPVDENYLEGYRLAADAVAALWGDAGAELGWSTMRYGCQGAPARQPWPENVIQEGLAHGHIKRGEEAAWRQRRAAIEPCGWEHIVWLAVGVEGPAELKEAKTFIPCPFYCGGCGRPGCDGRLAHIEWSDDRVFTPRRIPDHVARFYVPTGNAALEHARKGYGGADYHDPSGVTR